MRFHGEIAKFMQIIFIIGLFSTSWTIFSLPILGYLGTVNLAQSLRKSCFRKWFSLYEAVQKGKFPLWSASEREIPFIKWSRLRTLSQRPISILKKVVARRGIEPGTSGGVSSSLTNWATVTHRKLLSKNIVFKVKTRLYQTETYLSKLRRQ